MMTKPWLGLVGVCFLVASSAFAAVEPFSRDFSKSFTDAEFRVGPYRWPLIRTYNSDAAQTPGIFGRGWCSTLENKIVLNQGVPTLVVCGQGQNIAFRKTKVANRFVSASGSNLELKNSVYLREIENSYFERYSEAGAFLGLVARSGETLKVQGIAGKSQKIEDSQGRVYQLIFGTDGFVSQLKGSGEALIYKYDERGLLVGVEQNTIPALKMNYDSQKRLSEIIYPDETRIKLEFERAGGKVSRIILRDRCQEKFEPESNAKNRALQTSVIVMERRCPGRAAAKFTFTKKELIFSKTQKRIVSTETSGPRISQKMVFHPQLHKPVRIVRNDQTSFLYYDDLGRLSGVRTGDTLLERELGASGRVESVVSTHFQTSMVPFMREEAKFLYNEKGHYVGLAKSSGAVVRIRVDGDGNWLSFTDGDGAALSAEKAYLVLRSVDPYLQTLNSAAEEEF
jgi:YD repeat-containing protein